MKRKLFIIALAVVAILGLNAQSASAVTWSPLKQVTCAGWTYTFQWTWHDFTDSQGYRRQVIDDVFMTPGPYNTSWEAAAAYTSAAGTHWQGGQY